MKQQYIQALIAQGYEQKWSKEPYIFTRMQGEECYVVLLLEREVSAERLQEKRQQLEQHYRMQGFSYVYQLCIVCRKEAMFSQGLLELVEKAPNVWLFTEDQNRMFRYEHQPMEFDGLCGILEALPVERRNPLPFTVKTAPWVTLILIIVNLYCYLVPLLTGHYTEWIEAGMNYRPLVLEQGQLYRLFTHMFLHGSWEHLFNNMLVLCVLGLYLEPVLGHIRYSIIYLGSGIAGGLLSACMQFSGHGSVGASGAIFGLSGALLALVLFWKGKIPGLSVRRVIFMCIASLYGGFTSTNVDNAAHVGGLIAGFLLLIFTNISHKNCT